MKRALGIGFAAAALAASPALAQTVQGGVVVTRPTAPPAPTGQLGGILSAVTGSSLGGSGSFTTSVGGFMGAISGAPYYGESINETVQTLADGTHITRSMPGQRTWRDSSGRTRTERQMGVSTRPNAPKPPLMIEIRDPVAGVVYILDTQNKVAHRVAVPAPPQGMQAVRPINATASLGAARVVTSSSVNAEGVENRTESLGTQSIEGVTVMGTRTTTIYPVNYDGNDRPITVTREMWQAPELGLVILSKSNDPRNGESTQKIANLSRVEPDITLFQPPPDYSVVDDPGPSVTIRYTMQR